VAKLPHLRHTQADMLICSAWSSWQRQSALAKRRDSGMAKTSKVRRSSS